MTRKRKQTKRKAVAVTAQDKATAKRINGSRNIHSFSSSLEIAYRRNNLNRAVLQALKSEVSSSALPLNSKKARLRRIQCYASIVRS